MIASTSGTNSHTRARNSNILLSNDSAFAARNFRDARGRKLQAAALSPKAQVEGEFSRLEGGGETPWLRPSVSVEDRAAFTDGNAAVRSFFGVELVVDGSLGVGREADEGRVAGKFGSGLKSKRAGEHTLHEEDAGDPVLPEEADIHNQAQWAR